jgi:protein phosphatase
MRIRDDVELANASDVGCVRQNNEDYFLFSEPADDAEFARRGRLLLVCDGMGGCNGGEVASQLAAEAVRAAFLADETGDPRQALIEGFRRAQQAVLAAADDDHSLTGMGTTCSAAILRDGHLYLGHIGDSRIYLLRAGQARQLTEDHTLVARMVRDGLLSAEEAERHEQRNILTQALGLDANNVAGDFPPEPEQLAAGDVVLLCSDGLHGLVSGREMALTAADQPLNQACLELVTLAIVKESS